MSRQAEKESTPILKAVKSWDFVFSNFFVYLLIPIRYLIIAAKYEHNPKEWCFGHAVSLENWKVTYGICENDHFYEGKQNYFNYTDLSKAGGSNNW